MESPAASRHDDRPPRRVAHLVLLGHPVGHSLSPTFQNAALSAAGLDLRYEPIDVWPADLARTLAALRVAGGAGNVTVPYKRAVAEQCDELTARAREVGAVNTFWCADEGSLVGDNTDVAGAQSALRALREAQDTAGLPPAMRGVRDAPTRVALLGAGGAAAAVVAAVRGVWPRARILVCARRPDAAAALAARDPERVEVAARPRDAVGSVDVVVNATPLGLRAEDPLPCPIGGLRSNAAVLDLVYGADETAWVRAARAAGHVAQDGLTMLVEQGAAAFERWFGRAPDRAAMWRAVHERTGRALPAGVDL